MADDDLRAVAEALREFVQQHETIIGDVVIPHPPAECLSWDFYDCRAATQARAALARPAVQAARAGAGDERTLLLGDVLTFLDVTVREWLPSEHSECAINSGCAHGAMERDMYEELDRYVDRVADALTDAQAAKGTTT